MSILLSRCEERLPPREPLSPAAGGRDSGKGVSLGTYLVTLGDSV